MVRSAAPGRRPGRRRGDQVWHGGPGAGLEKAPDWALKGPVLGDDETPRWAPKELLPTWRPSQDSASDIALHRWPKILSLSALRRDAGTATADVLGRTPRRASSSSPSSWHAARELARLALASLALCRLCLEAAHSLGATGPVAGSLSAGGCCQAARESASVARAWRKVARLAQRQLPPPETRPQAAAMSPAQSAWPTWVPPMGVPSKGWTPSESRHCTPSRCSQRAVPRRRRAPFAPPPARLPNGRQSWTVGLVAGLVGVPVCSAALMH
eukprot:scaffold22192_cov49-Phaeocystis_antarctica.AAC.1